MLGDYVCGQYDTKYGSLHVESYKLRAPQDDYRDYIRYDEGGGEYKYDQSRTKCNEEDVVWDNSLGPVVTVGPSRAVVSILDPSASVVDEVTVMRRFVEDSGMFWEVETGIKTFKFRAYVHVRARRWYRTV